MMSRALAILAAGLLTVSATGFAQEATREIDPVTVSPQNYKVLLENEHIRVLRYEIAPGQRDAIHTHPPKAAYVVSGGSLRIFPEGGAAFDVEETDGAIAWMETIGRHYAENTGSTPVVILLVEVKSAETASQ